MSRIAAKLLLLVAILGGTTLAASNAWNPGAGELPSAPTGNTTTEVRASDATTDEGIVNGADWQQTRITVGKTSNVIPTAKKK